MLVSLNETVQDLVQQALGTFEVCFANLLNAFEMLVSLNETVQYLVQQALGTFEDCLQTY